MSDMLRIGIDIGSTTVKVVVINEKDEMLFSRYERHYSEILETVKKLVSEAHDEIGDASVSAMITGSGGVALSEAVGSRSYGKRHRERNTPDRRRDRAWRRGREDHLF